MFVLAKPFEGQAWIRKMATRAAGSEATTAAGSEATTGLHVLVVFAHQERKSFNGALLQKAEQVLKTCGHSVAVSDLYQMNFEPRATIRDFPGKLVWLEQLQHLGWVFVGF